MSTNLLRSNGLCKRCRNRMRRNSTTDYAESLVRPSENALTKRNLNKTDFPTSIRVRSTSKRSRFKLRTFKVQTPYVQGSKSHCQTSKYCVIWSTVTSTGLHEPAALRGRAWKHVGSKRRLVPERIRPSAIPRGGCPRACPPERLGRRLVLDLWQGSKDRPLRHLRLV